MKTNEKQGFSYKKLLIISSLVCLAGLAAVPNWTRQRDEERVISAKRHAEILGYQVFEIYRQASQALAGPDIINSRSPASMRTSGGNALNFRETGSIGNDSWGQPYRYKVLSVLEDQFKVQIWSSGPNKTFETKDEPGVGVDSYTGDDVGIVLSLNQKPTE